MSWEIPPFAAFAPIFGQLTAALPREPSLPEGAALKTAATDASPALQLAELDAFDFDVGSVAAAADLVAPAPAPVPPAFTQPAPAPETQTAPDSTSVGPAAALVSGEIVPTAPTVWQEAQVALSSGIFSTAVYYLDARNDEKIMLVLSAGQSLSYGTTRVANFDTIWTGAVDRDRAYMLDYGNDGWNTRGWNHRDAEPWRLEGLTPMRSQVTETPAPAMMAQILDAYDSAGRIAPNMLHVPTSAVGASLLELMTGADDLFASTASGLGQTSSGDLFAVERKDGRFDYYVNDHGRAQWLDTMQRGPGLWDTMLTQIESAARATAAAGLDVHDTVAIGFVHGAADADLRHAIYGYSWAATKYFDMLEASLRTAFDRADLSLTVAMSQTQGADDGLVPLAQLALALDDPRITLAGSQYQFRFSMASDPGKDNRHLTPEGYFHMGQSLGAGLSDALLGRGDDPILISAVTRLDVDSITVRFSGLDGTLTEDTSFFDAAQGYLPPDYFGFKLTDLVTGLSVTLTGAAIAGSDSVVLDTDALPGGAYQLALGLHGQDLAPGQDPSIMQSYNTVTLRDSVPTASMIAPDSYDGAWIDVLDFAPIQSFEFDL